MKWAVHVARMGKMRNWCKIAIRLAEGEAPYWRIILKWILNK
jgi:hypothetical protein